MRNINSIMEEKNPLCECGVIMEIFKYCDGCTMFWRCPECLKFGEYIPDIKN